MLSLESRGRQIARWHVGAGYATRVTAYLLAE